MGKVKHTPAKRNNQEEVEKKVETKATMATRGELTNTREDNSGGEMEEKIQQLLQLLTLKIQVDEQRDSKVKISTENFDKVISECDGRSIPIIKWFEVFEANADAYGLTDKQKYVQARGKMCGTAKLFLEAETVSDYTGLKQALIDEFRYNWNSAEIHQQLRERRKKQSETFHEYMLVMKKIASIGNIEEAAVLRYIVDGLDIKNEYKFAMYRSKSFKELKDEFCVYEQLHINEKKFSSMQKQSVVNKEQVAQNKRKVHCFNPRTLPRVPRHPAV